MHAAKPRIPGNRPVQPALISMKLDGDEETKGMSEAQNPAIDWIIANTINDTARGDPDALAGRIIVDLAKAGYRIVSRKSLISLLEDSAQGSACDLEPRVTPDVQLTRRYVLAADGSSIARCSGSANIK